MAPTNSDNVKNAPVFAIMAVIFNRPLFPKNPKITPMIGATMMMANKV